MENIKYWIWLTSKKGIRSTRIMTLLEHFGDISEIYRAKSYDDVAGIRQSEKDELLDKNLDDAEEVIERMEIIGGRIVTVDDPEYPPSLIEINPVPFVLYMKGERINWKEQLTIGVVGARECTDYGKVATQKLSYEMAAAGILVVSGMARGIDSIAAVSALKAGGKTVAVLGCGLDIVYPPEHSNLMRAICDNGVVITEYPPTTRPNRHNFPQRNRIISGLSRGLLVVEAGRKSGTLSTVSYARDFGRDIFAVPGGIFHEKSEGTNNMIKEGAILTTSVTDIFETYPYEASVIKRPTGKPVYVKDYEYKSDKEDNTNSLDMEEEIPEEERKTVTVEDSRYKGLNANEKKIIELLIKKDMHIDELVRESGINIQTVNAILPVLEMMGHIRKMTGNNYKLDI